MENFWTLWAETEEIINSRPFTVETLSDVNSQIPLSPINLLTQKTNVLVTLTDQTCTHGTDGDKFIISLGSFGLVGEMNFFRAFKYDKKEYKKTRL